MEINKMKNVNLENMLSEAGQMLNIGKEEVKNTLKSRKNIAIAFVLFVLGLFLVQGITYGTFRYAGASINDFIQMGKFL